MQFRFEVNATVERTQGKFASREDIAEIIRSALEESGPDTSGVGPDGDSEYECSIDDVSEVDADGRYVSKAESNTQARKLRLLEAVQAAAARVIIAEDRPTGPGERNRARKALLSALVKSGAIEQTKQAAPGSLPACERCSGVIDRRSKVRDTNEISQFAAGYGADRRIYETGRASRKVQSDHAGSVAVAQLAGKIKS